MGLQSIKEQRYKDRYFGKITKSKELNKIHLEGLLSAIGLVKVFSDGKETKITLTEKGKKFCLFENPVFKGSVEESLSKDESEFISAKCIPQRPLQHEVVKNIIRLVTETEHGKSADMADQLDEVCQVSIEQFMKSNRLEVFQEKIEREIIGKTNEILSENQKIDKAIENAGNDEAEVRKLKKTKKQK